MLDCPASERRDCEFQTLKTTCERPKIPETQKGSAGAARRGAAWTGAWGDALRLLLRPGLMQPPEPSLSPKSLARPSVRMGGGEEKE